MIKYLPWPAMNVLNSSAPSGYKITINNLSSLRFEPESKWQLMPKDFCMDG